MAPKVEFDADKNVYAGTQAPSSGVEVNAPIYSPGVNEPKMISWLIRHGYVKTAGAGNKVLLVVVVINIIIMIFVFYKYV